MKNKRKDLPEKLVINNTIVVEKQENAENQVFKYLRTLAPT